MHQEESGLKQDQTVEKSLPQRFLEVKFPGSPVKRFGICYTGFVDRQTALKSFSQDLMGAALGGLPGLILLGGKLDFYAEIILIGILEDDLVMCDIGYVPVKATNIENATVSYEDTIEALTLALKEPDKIKTYQDACNKFKFSFSIEENLIIKGEIERDLSFVPCFYEGALNSSEEAILVFEGLDNLLKPEELLYQLREGDVNISNKEVEKILSSKAYCQSFKGKFSDSKKEERIAILNRFQEFPKPLQLFFVNWFKESFDLKPKLFIISLAITIVSFAALFHIVNGLMYHADEESLMGMITYPVGIGGLIFSGIGWLCVIHHAWYVKWYKKWKNEGF